MKTFTIQKNRTKFLSIILTSLLLSVFFKCTDNVEITRKYTIVEPEYLTIPELRASFDIMPADTLKKPGKIYLYENYIFVNEYGEGLHIIDNTDPANPKIIQFINIPGNFDMAVKGDILYADSYMDLVVLDISNPQKITLLERIENIFQNNNSDIPFDPEKGVIIGWAEKEVVEVSSGDFDGNFPQYFYYGLGGIAMDMRFANSAEVKTNFAPAPSTAGIGGSMARFTIKGDHLYAIDRSNLHVFDISNLTLPVVGANLNVGWGIETIFPYKDNLFLGSQTGMHIYDISTPDYPIHLSTFAHIRSCDPVVVKDTIAFVTLRGGTVCRNDFTNQLDVLDIRNLRDPILLTSYPMFNPHGLGVDGDLLFICDGKRGLVVYETNDLFKITDNKIAEFTGIDAFDVIPFQNVLLMIGNEGLFQYDYSNPENIKLLSTLPVYRDEELQ